VTVREFNGTTDRLVTDVGAASGMTYGTWAAIVKFSDLSDFRGIAYVHDAGGSYKGAFGTTNFSRFSINDGSNDSNLGAVTLATGVWYLCIVRKDAGSGITPRFSVYNFTTSAWTHGAGSAAVNDFVAPGAGGTHQFAYQGGAASIFAGRVAARAHWSNVLPWTPDSAGDTAIAAAGLETMASNWAAANPSVFQLFNQASVSDPVVDLSATGTADQVSIVGTTVVTTDDPPGFDFSLTGPSGELDLTGSGTLTAAGAPSLAGALTSSGSGSLSAAGSPETSDQLDLAGAGVLALAGAAHAVAQCALSGAGVLAAAGRAATAAALALGGVGHLALTSPSVGQPDHESVLTATNAPSSVLAASNAPSSRLEATHGV
jgi:hypothetical protein